MPIPIINKCKRPIIVDLFCGGGGVSSGIKSAIGRGPDLAVNHSPIAIQMHKLNHPETIHFPASVWDVAPKKTLQKIEAESVGLLWLSPDCRHFSRAKGGKPVSPRVRVLARIAISWARYVRPKVICLENVKEFEDWGPLIPKKDPETGRLLKLVLVKSENGKNKFQEVVSLPDEDIPISQRVYTPDQKRLGQYFNRYIKDLQKLGYTVSWKILNAADYGAPTHRNRLFLIARSDGQPTVWPSPSHGPGLRPYLPAADCIDWSIPIPSIFNRDKPLVEKTQRRIAAGLDRFVLQAGKQPNQEVSAWISKFYGTAVGSSLDQPLSTISAQGQHHALCAAKHGSKTPKHVIAWIAKHYTGAVGQGLHRPLGTITTVDHHSLCVARTGRKTPEGIISWISTYYGTSGAGTSIHAPTPTITTKDRLAIVVARIKELKIVDIGLRMFTPRELARAQGFPEDYLLIGSNSDQVKMIGNSVSPKMAEAIIHANVPNECRLAMAA